MHIKKRIMGAVSAMVTALSLAVTASAVSSSDFNYSTSVVGGQVSRTYKASTVYTKTDITLDVITAGVSCCRLDTGATVGDGWLTENQNSRSAYADDSISYQSCPTQVRGFGSHSAYENGQTVLYKFTQSSAV